MGKSYKIAGLTVDMEYQTGRFPITIPYETEYIDHPDIILIPEYEYVGLDPTDIENCSLSQKSIWEHCALAASFYVQLLDFDGFMIHSSAIVMDGKAYLFTADSGTGKSTHTAMYRRAFGDDRVRILNDDKPAIRQENGEFFAYGTPWSGKTNLNLNLRVPVGGICLLRRGETNTIRRMKTRESLFAILGQTPRPKDPQKMNHLMDLIGKLIEAVPVWEMHCNIDPEAARVSYAAMSGAGKEEEK